jgi:hypothetical protein
MESNREEGPEQIHFEGEPGEDMGWGPWGHGPWGRGPHMKWGRGPRGPRGPWAFGGPFGGRFWGGFGPGPGPFGSGFGGPFGGFGPESKSAWEALAGVGFDVMRLLRAGVLASGGDTARLAQLRGILERARDDLNAFLGQGKSSSGENPAAGATPTSGESGPII